MYFFLEYLSHFDASEILDMYGDGAFRTCEEIKAADFMISLKIIFQDHHISSENLEKYNHMQRVVDAIRLRQQANRPFGDTEEFHRYFTSAAVHFTYFVKHNEAEKEVLKFNVFERKVTVSFVPIDENLCTVGWLKEALEELLNYVLRDTTKSDRIGLVIKYENLQCRNSAFPIKLKDHLTSSLKYDILTTLLQTAGSLVTGQKMNLQVVRVRFPLVYRRLTVADVEGITGFKI